MSTQPSELEEIPLRRSRLRAVAEVAAVCVVVATVLAAVFLGGMHYQDERNAWVDAALAVPPPGEPHGTCDGDAIGDAANAHPSEEPGYLCPRDRHAFRSYPQSPLASYRVEQVRCVCPPRGGRW